MKRIALKHLKDWSKAQERKPLILRGARQVGKSTLVHIFCKEESLDLIEFNFEIEKLNSIENVNFDLQSLLDEIQLKKKTIITNNTLIFFDEIQESPRLLKLLRYFYEKRPDIKIIAAGSLLEIALKSDNFSFPVGRVEFYHLGPMTFREFLWATDQNFLDSKLCNFNFSKEVHQAALEALKNYYYVGGMPAAVKVFAETKSLVKMRNIQEQIIQTYQADFPKYNKRTDVHRITRIFNALALYVGQKIIFTKLDPDSTSKVIKSAVELLIDSRVILPCTHSDGNSVPLLGESDSRIFKTYFLDIGLLNSILNLDLQVLETEFKNNFNTKGMIAEQFVAQHLNFIQSPSKSPYLTYHLKDKGSQKAEVDFLIEIGSDVYPIEVKATSKGHLKSLRYFCESKKSKLGIKLSLDSYSVDHDFVEGTPLANIPIYAVEYIRDNISKIMSDSNSEK